MTTTATSYTFNILLSNGNIASKSYIADSFSEATNMLYNTCYALNAKPIVDDNGRPFCDIATTTAA